MERLKIQLLIATFISFVYMIMLHNFLKFLLPQNQLVFIFIVTIILGKKKNLKVSVSYVNKHLLFAHKQWAMLAVLLV